MRPRYRSIIDNIRRYMPDASISGDVIVGFPGERPARLRVRSAAVFCIPLSARLMPSVFVPSQWLERIAPAHDVHPMWRAFR